MKPTTWTLLLASLSLVALTTRGFAADEPAKDDFVPVLTLSPAVTYQHVEGNSGQFRSDHWLDDDPLSGGVDELTIDHKLVDKWQLHIDGRAIFDEQDYRLRLEIVNPDVGFVRAGYSEYRQYFGSTGGFYKPFTIPAFNLVQDPHLDISRIWAEMGLTLPNLPRITIGWEQDSRDGQKSLLEYGPVTQGPTTRRIYPSLQDIDETVDIFKAQADYTIGKVDLGDEFRYEHYRIGTKTLDDSQLTLPAAAPTQTVTVDQKYSHDAYINTFHMDSHLTEKVYWSLGYLFNDVTGVSAIALNTVPFGPNLNDKDWFSNGISLDTQSHVLNVNTLLGPWKGFSIYGGLQGEWTDSDAFGNATLAEFGGTTSGFADTHTDQVEYDETLGVRYTTIPHTTLFAEGKLTESDIQLNERELIDGTLDPANAFQRATDAEIFRQRYTVGFNTAPFRPVTISSHYRYTDNQNDYENTQDFKTNGGVFIDQQGYPAFIRSQGFETQEVSTKLTVRPMSRLAVSLQYQYVTTDFETATDAVPALGIPQGSIESGQYQSQIYSLSATATPLNRLYVMGLVSYQDTRTTAFDNQSPTVVAYRGNVYTVVAAAGYALTEKTDVTADYTFYRADDCNNNAAFGLPLGLDNASHSGTVTLIHKFNKNFTARARYGIYYYHDTANAGLTDYTANLASLSCTLRF